MKNYMKMFVPFALAIVIGSMTFTFAQTTDKNFGGKPPRGERGDRGERPMPPPPGGGLNPRMLDQLNLTAEQKQQIDAIQLNARDAGKENFDKVRSFDEQLRKAVEGGNFNEEEVRAILNSKSQLMIESEILRLRADTAVYKILTAEQKTQLEQLKAQRPEPPPFGGRGFRPEERPQN